MRRQHELFCCRLCLRHLKVRASPPPVPLLSCRTQPGRGGAPGARSPHQRRRVPLVSRGCGKGPPRRPAPSSLQIFTYERKWYSRKDLARHRMQGDPDDTSHRGHPLCKFCDERYLDNDELLKHLRRDHYFCHFCDSDGAQDYYR